MVHVGGYMRRLRIIFCNEVDRYAILGQPNLLGKKCLVVARIEPRERARDEGLLQRLCIFQGFDRLRPIDGNGPVFLREIRVMAPKQPVGICVCVVNRIAQGKTGRVIKFLQLAGREPGIDRDRSVSFRTQPALPRRFDSCRVLGRHP